MSKKNFCDAAKKIMPVPPIVQSMMIQNAFYDKFKMEHGEEQFKKSWAYAISTEWPNSYVMSCEYERLNEIAEARRKEG